MEDLLLQAMQQQLDFLESIETLTNVLYAVITAQVVLGVRVEFMARAIRLVKADTGHMKIQHDHPDDYDFGTKKTNALLRELNHYLRQLIRLQDPGREPEPFVDSE